MLSPGGPPQSFPNTVLTAMAVPALPAGSDDLAAATHVEQCNL